MGIWKSKMSMENDLDLLNRNVTLSTKVAVKLPQGKSAKFSHRQGILTNLMDNFIGILVNLSSG